MMRFRFVLGWAVLGLSVWIGPAQAAYFCDYVEDPSNYMNTAGPAGFVAVADIGLQGRVYRFRHVPGSVLVLQVLSGQVLEAAETGRKDLTQMEWRVSGSDHPWRLLGSAQNPGYQIFRLASGTSDIDLRLTPSARGVPRLIYRGLEVSQTRDPAWRFPWLGPIVGAGFILAAWIKRRRPPAPGGAPGGPGRAAAICLVAALLTWGAWSRWLEVSRLWDAPIASDSAKFLRNTDRMNLGDPVRGFYSASFNRREPMFILAAKGLTAFGGRNPQGIRVVSFAFSVAVIALTFGVGRRVLASDMAAGIATALVALCPTLVWESAFGLRTEWETCLWLVLAGVLFSPPNPWWDRGRGGINRRCVAVGCLGGALLLTRTHAVLAVAGWLAVGMIRQAGAVWRRLVWAAAAFALSLLWVAPHLGAVYQRSGSPLGDWNRYAAFHGRLEGLADESHLDQMSISDYFFKERQAWQWLAYPLAGQAVALANIAVDLGGVRHALNDLLKWTWHGRAGWRVDPPGVWEWVSVAGVLAAFFGLLGRSAWGPNGWVFWVLVLAVAHGAFFYGASVFAKAPIIGMHRPVAHAIPLAAWAMGDAVRLVWNRRTSIKGVRSR